MGADSRGRMSPVASLKEPRFDRILEIEPGVSAVANLHITGTMPLFATHFPRYPVLPGVFLVESGIALVRLAAQTPGLRLRAARELRFRRFLVPGDLVELTVSVVDDGPAPCAGDSVWRLVAKAEGKTAATISHLTLSSR